ncbi:death-associated protein kinase 1 [Daphnia magna]|uniref:death-associated protein kinase 1 n=1 Tax=Daphnia magna TaxID=35525 RepID=UPI001E1BC3D7|nr:death-associated protein kinase 1 [Daphnia magna]
MEDHLGQVFERNSGGRDVERVMVYRVHKNKEEAMLKLNHPNIVKHFRCVNDDDYVFYELEPCVTSLDQLFLDPNDPKKYKGPMPQHIDALLQLASGLQHIHSQNLVHGDIQPENVLISVESGGNDETTLKWANFELTRNVSERGRGNTNKVGRNNAWLAPELQLTRKRKRDVEENSYIETAMSDVFAQGLVFGTLFLNGEHLYGSMKNEKKISQNIIKGNPINMQKIDGKLRAFYENDLLKKMLESDPGKRMTSTQVVSQLKAIKEKLAEKEKELIQLCGRDSQSDLTKTIRNFIPFGINLNAKDDDGRNALHALCQNYSSTKLTDAIKLLIENKTDVNARDNDGLNAIHFLCRYHSSQNLIEAIQILIQSGIDAKATTNDGSNALHYLCRYNARPNLTDAVTIFTELGLDLMTKDNDGWSAFYYLQNKDKKEMKIRFDRDALLGRGGFAYVFKGKFGGREVAVKRVELLEVDEREEEAMLKLEHPNIVKLLHYEKDNDFMYYALELCVASLDQLFLELDNRKKYDGPMPRQIVVFSQLAKGLEYIHSKKLIYRDIKPSNILIMKSPGKNEEIIIKWSDFGLAKSVNEKGLHSWTGVRGTRSWYAPEVLKKLIKEEKAEQEEFWGTVQSDVFVLGLVFGYLFLKGEHLYGSSETEIHINIIEKNPVNMQKINGELRKYYADDLLMKMLEDDPQKRKTSKEVVEQLESINNKLTEKEEELRQLCRRDSSSGLIEKINDLIQLGIDVNAKDNDGRNALHHLCRNNSNSNLLDAIRLLIQLGIDVNAKDNDGHNALHDLCDNNSNSNLTDAIRLFIQLGIDANAKDNEEWNALHFLCGNNSNSNLTDAIRLLIQLGIDVNAKDNYGHNALHHLCRNNSNSNLLDAIRLLIQLGIDVNAKDNKEWNALHFVCGNNSNSNLTDAIRLLIQLGIDVNAKANYGHNALHLLCGHNSNSNLTDAIRLFIQLGIDVNAKNNYGHNALHYLCQNNSNSNLIDAIRLFIQLGIPVVSDGADARSILRDNFGIKNKGEILKLLDEAALV